MGPVEARVFAFLSAGSLSATAYFRIPPERVVELGTQLDEWRGLRERSWHSRRSGGG